MRFSNTKKISLQGHFNTNFFNMDLFADEILENWNSGKFISWRRRNW